MDRQEVKIEYEEFSAQKHLGPVEEVMVGGSTRVDDEFINSVILGDIVLDGRLKSAHFIPPAHKSPDDITRINEIRRKKRFMKTQTMFGLGGNSLLSENGLSAAMVLGDLDESGEVAREREIVLIDDKGNIVVSPSLMNQLDFSATYSRYCERKVSPDGASMTVSFQKAEGVEKAEKSDSVEAEPRKKLHLLTIEDDVMIRAVQKMAFIRYGIDHLSAEDVEEARRLLKENPSINALISDVHLPGMNGDVFAKEMREKYPDMPIALATSIEAGDEEMQKFLKEQNIDHIHKPYSIESLIQLSKMMEEQINTKDKDDI